MDWPAIVNKLRLLEEHFDKAYKCLNTPKAPTRDETVEKHLNVLFTRFEQIRTLINVNYTRLTHGHQRAAENYFLQIRNKLTNVLSRRDLNINIPESIHEELKYDPEIQAEKFSSSVLPSTSTKKVSENLASTKQTETNTEQIPDNLSISKNMAQTVTQFLGLASKILPDFDGKPENLQSFLDALALVDSVKDAHEQVAINLIKTKLKGTARNLLTNEATITAIVDTLRGSVKGESVEVITAKLMNVRQAGKNANTYASEVETLTKSLEGAYISDGLPCTLATKYSTQTAVKAITKNCSNDKVKLIMEAGQFNTMNDAIAKFVSSCTEATGQQNAVLYYKKSQNHNNPRRGGYNSRGNNRRNNNNYRNNNGNNERNNNNNRRGRNGHNYRNGYDNRSNSSRVMTTNSNNDYSENSESPLRSSN